MCEFGVDKRGQCFAGSGVSSQFTGSSHVHSRPTIPIRLIFYGIDDR